jgi:hypothetical protein
MRIAGEERQQRSLPGSSDRAEGELITNEDNANVYASESN